MTATLALLLTYSGNGANGQTARSRDIVEEVTAADAAAHPDGAFVTFADRSGVVAMFLAPVGQSPDLITAIRACGGTIQFENGRIDYVRAHLPEPCYRTIRQGPLVLSSRLDGAAGASRIMWVDDEAATRYAASPDARRYTRPSATTTPQDEVTAAELHHTSADRQMWQDTNDDDAIGLTRFRDMHPTYDGRGVTIAIVEGGATRVALEHPAFAPAKAIGGEPIPKIAAIINTDTTRSGSLTIAALEIVESEERLVRVKHNLYVLPRPGRFALGRFEYGQEVFFVLWDAVAREAWCDVGHDQDFSNDRAMRDVLATRDVTTFPEGTVPWSGSRMSVTFGLDATHLTVSLGQDSHALMTASIAAGTDTEENPAPGVAPNARLALVESAGALSVAHASLEAILAAASDPNIDILSISETVMADVPRGSVDFAALAYDRIGTAFNKLIVKAADNVPGPEQTENAGVASLSVGAYMSGRAAALADRAVVPIDTEYILPFSSRGPMADGRLAPDLVAPARRLAAFACDDPTRRLLPASARPLPRCARVAGGTSAAAPAVAGMAALLLSAARQADVPVSAARLRWALQSSARFIPGWPSNAQGAGLPQLSTAWNLLRSTRDLPTIEVQAPLVHALTAYRTATTRTTGGLYEREGWAPGQSGSRIIAIRRIDQANGADSYDLQWLGNDGSFRTSRRVSLPRDQWIEVPIDIHVSTSGVHAAVLVLRDRTTHVAVRHIACTVIASDALKAADAFGLAYDATLGAYSDRAYPFVVPPHADAMVIETRASAPLWAVLLEPAGWIYHRYKVPAPRGRLRDGVQRFVIPTPATGTWILQMGQDTAAATPTALHVTIKAHKQSIQAGRVEERSLRLKLVDTMAASDTSQLETILATQNTTTCDPSLDTCIANLDVPRGATMLAVRATASGNPLSLLLYNCTSNTCLRYDVIMPAMVAPFVELQSPAAGLWRVVTTRGPAGPDALPAAIEWTVGGDATPLPNGGVLNPADLRGPDVSRASRRVLAIRSLALRCIPQPRGPEGDRGKSESGCPVPPSSLLELDDTFTAASLVSPHR